MIDGGALTAMKNLERKGLEFQQKGPVGGRHKLVKCLKL
jgi:hypothetical protein